MLFKAHIGYRRMDIAALHIYTKHILSYAPHIMVCMDVWSKAKQA